MTGDVELPLHEWGIDRGRGIFARRGVYRARRQSWRGARQHLRLDPQTNPALLLSVCLRP